MNGPPNLRLHRDRGRLNLVDNALNLPQRPYQYVPPPMIQNAPLPPLRIDLGLIENKDPELYHNLLVYFRRQVMPIHPEVRDTYYVDQDAIRDKVVKIHIRSPILNLNRITDILNDYLENQHQPSVEFYGLDDLPLYRHWLSDQEDDQKASPSVALKIKD